MAVITEEPLEAMRKWTYEEPLTSKQLHADEGFRLIQEQFQTVTKHSFFVRRRVWQRARSQECIKKAGQWPWYRDPAPGGGQPKTDSAPKREEGK